MAAVDEEDEEKEEIQHPFAALAEAIKHTGELFEGDEQLHPLT